MPWIESNAPPGMSSAHVRARALCHKMLPPYENWRVTIPSTPFPCGEILPAACLPMSVMFATELSSQIGSGGLASADYEASNLRRASADDRRFQNLARSRN